MYSYNGAPPCTYQVVNAHAGEASQFMAPRPPQTDYNTASLAPIWQHGMEQNRIESAGCVATHASNNNDTYCNPRNEIFQDPEHVVVEGGAPINYWQIYQGTVEWNNNISPPTQPVRDDKLSDFSPDAWKLSPRDMESMFIDYYHDKAADTVEVAAFQARHNQFNAMTDPLNDEFAFQHETDFEQNSYWPTYFNMVRSEEQWIDVELNEISYAEEAAEFILNPEPEMKAEMLEPQIIMATDETGQSTPMACGIMLVKSIQGRPCSRLLKVLYDSGGSKSMIKKSILPKGVRVTQSNNRMLMNTLAGTYAPLGSVEIKGMQLPAFDKNRIIAEHGFMVFDQHCSYDIILGGDFLRKIGMNLQYDDLTIEWLGKTASMNSLNNPQLVAR